MPATSAAPAHAGLTRRTAVLGALALGASAAGCTAEGPRGAIPTTPRPSPSPDADVTLAAKVLTDEQRMLDTVRATGRRHHRLRAVLSAAASTHERHVQVLRDATPQSPAPSGQPSGQPSRVGSSRVSVPADPQQALRRLVRDEDRLSVAAKRGSFAAQSGPFARLLASMAAAAAQQSVALGQHSAAEPARR